MILENLSTNTDNKESGQPSTAYYKRDGVIVPLQFAGPEITSSDTSTTTNINISLEIDSEGGIRMSNFKNESTSTLSDFPFTMNDELIGMKTIFLKSASNDKFEPGDSSSAELLVKKLFKSEPKEKVFNWLNDLFVENNTNPHIAIGILQILSHLEFAKNNNSAQVIATSALLNENIEVEEYGIRCFENWEDKRFIPTLKRVNYDNVWLKEYLAGVIEDLQGEA
jgi:hypothetical protein